MSAIFATSFASGQLADVKGACLYAHEQAQIARKTSRFADARAHLLMCAQESCPGLVRADCVEWLSELEKVYPSIVFDAYVDGRQALSVYAYADGQLVTDRIDGKSVKMDPGRHTFRLQVAGFPPSDQVIVLPEGAQGHIVTASFVHPKVVLPEPAARRRPVPRTVWIAGGTAVIATGSLATFGGLALSEKSKLEQTCSPFCSGNQMTGLRNDMGGANISLGVAIAAAALGGVLFLLRPDVEPQSTPALLVTPTMGGGTFSLVERF